MHSYINFIRLSNRYGNKQCIEMYYFEFQIFQKYEVQYHYEALDYFIHPMYTPNGPLKFTFRSKN